MYSFYEILGMIASKQEPKTVELQLVNGKKVIYDADYDCVNGSFTCYIIRDRKDEDENYRFYLSECFLESDVFDKKIRILTKQGDILDDVERRYLADVIRPFKKRLMSITLVNCGLVSKDAYLVFELDDDAFELPIFEIGTMYAGMKPHKEYTLEELGL